ncbi:unnamed protein product [Mucor hiemalis]
MEVCSASRIVCHYFFSIQLYIINLFISGTQVLALRAHLAQITADSVLHYGYSSQYYIIGNGLLSELCFQKGSGRFNFKDYCLLNANTMSWAQREIRLKERRRGCHLVHKEIVGQLPELKNFKIGMANFFCNEEIKASVETVTKLIFCSATHLCLFDD